MAEEVIHCDECQLPAAKIVAGALVIECRHHGEKHKTVVSVSDLVAIANDQVDELLTIDSEAHLN